MNLQISKKSTLNTQKISPPDWTTDDHITLDTVLLYKLTALQSHKGRERAASGPRQERKNIQKCSESANLRKILHFPNFLTNTVENVN